MEPGLVARQGVVGGQGILLTSQEHQLRVPLRAFVEGAYRDLDERTPQLSFAEEEYADRLMRLRKAMADASIDTVVLTAPDSMCWLHGYQSRWYRAHSPTDWPPLQCTVVNVNSDRIIHFDVKHHAHLLRLKSVAEPRLTDAEDGEDYLAFILAELRALGWLGTSLGMEFHSHVPNRAVSLRMSEAFEAAGCTVTDVTRVLREVRRVKSPAELARIEEAAAACDAGLLALQRGLRAGMTELDAWGILVEGMARAGGEPAALHESVVVGPIELGHAYSSRRIIQDGDVVCADPSGVVDRYHANIERYFVVGREPSEELRNLAAIEAEAFGILCAAATPGTPVASVSALLEEYLHESGLWGLHNWNGGYELGIAFPPDWVGEWHFHVGEKANDAVFVEGMVTNYESIILYPMTDTIVIGPQGGRTLSSLPLDVLRAGEQ